MAAPSRSACSATILRNSLGAKEALLAANYVYQHPDPDNTFTRQLEHIVSVNFKFEAEKWGVRTDVSAAAGYLGQSDLWGVMAMPFFNVTDKLQFVGRYTFLDSERPERRPARDLRKPRGPRPWRPL